MACKYYIDGKTLTKDEFINYVKKQPIEESSKILGISVTPSAPFITDTNAYVKLGMRVALKEAVKQGADKIAWTTGEQQNERYDLRKSVDKLEWVYDKSLSKPTGTLYGWKDGKMIMEETMPENRLEDYIGKGVAENLLKASENDSPNYKGYSQKTLTGDEIKVGGKGMKGFYGSMEEGTKGIVGGVAEKVFGQKVGETKINKGTDDLTKNEALDLLRQGEKIYTYNRGSIFRLYDEKDINEANNYFSKKGEAKSTQPSIDITPELRASVEGGLPLFMTMSNDEIQNRFPDLDIDIVEKIKVAATNNSSRDGFKDMMGKLVDMGAFEQTEADQAIELFDSLQSEIEDDKKTPINEQPVEEVAAGGEGDITGVAHRHTDEIKEALGLPKYEPSPMTDEEIKSEADKQVSDGVNVIDILKRWEAGKFSADTIQVETELVKRYIGHMESLDKMSDTDIDNYKRALNILENVGRLFGKGLRSRVGDIEKRPDSLAEFLVDEMWSSRVDVLTEEQKAKVEKEFNDIKDANDKLNEKIAELEKQLSLQTANNVVSKEKKSAGRKRAIEDIKKERQDIFSSIKKKLKDSRSQFNTTPVPYANELITIAPDVAKLVRNYVEEGIVNLSEIVDGIHDIVKEISANIQKDDIIDIIAGKYNEPKKTKNEILTSIVNLKNQAKLISRLKDLEDGIEPKYERQKIKRNQEISDLRKKIDENSLHQLAKAKSNILAEISRLENDLESGNIAPAVKKEPIKLDREATILKDELIRLRKERAIRLLQEEYKNRSKSEKLKDMTMEVLNVPRTIMSSMDFSAPLRQGLVASVAHPTIAGKAFAEMFKQAVSQKRFDRWFQDVRESDEWPIMEQSGLYVADPHDYKLSAKEEQFMNNLAEKIPFIGKIIKGSERAYVSYLNKMRVDLFQQGANVLESMGMTFENSQEEYEGLASFINNSTGRGKLAKIGSVSLEDAAPVFNSIFFSPRLIASRLSLLNPMYYAKLPKYARIMALKDMSKFVGFGVTMLYLLKAAFGCEDNCTDCKNCIRVETDPRSTDFGKLRIGNTRYDVWGGFQQYARIIAQMVSGQSKSATSGKINDIDGKGLFGKDRADVLGSFVRGKLSPIPATILDFAAGRNIIGEPMTLEAAAERNLLPLIYSDVKDAIKEDGAKALFTVGLPATFGVGVNTYDPKKNKNKN